MTTYTATPPSSRRIRPLITAAASLAMTLMPAVRVDAAGLLIADGGFASGGQV